MTIEQRAELLEHVARMANADQGLIDWRPEVIAVCLERWVHPSLDALNGLALAWADYRDAVRLRDDVDAGTTDWWHVEPELTCMDRQEAAVQIAAERADQALAVLIHGRQS